MRIKYTNQHDSIFYALADRSARAIFDCSSHPIDEEKVTLAWSTMNIDIESGEALIEEVQNDWLRLISDRINDLYKKVLAEHSLSDSENNKDLFGEKGLLSGSLN